MPTFTVTSCNPTGTTRNWTNQQTGETVVFNNYAVQFAEVQGQWTVGRTARQNPPQPGQQLMGEIIQGQNGQYFKEQKAQRQGFQQGGGNGQTQKYGGRGGGQSESVEKQQSIMAQCALKSAVDMCIAQQKWDAQAVDFYTRAYYEIIVKVCDYKVEAQVPVQQPQPTQQPPQNGYQQPTNRVAQYAQQPQGFVQQTQPPVQQNFTDPGLSEGDYIPF